MQMLMRTLRRRTTTRSSVLAHRRCCHPPHLWRPLDARAAPLARAISPAACGPRSASVEHGAGMGEGNGDRGCWLTLCYPWGAEVVHERRKGKHTCMASPANLMMSPPLTRVMLISCSRKELM